jgi:hypothetical protein
MENETVPLLSFTDSPVTASEVVEAMTSLQAKKSEDYNGVSMFFFLIFLYYFLSLLNTS